MEWIKRGRARYIVNKFSTACDEASFQRVLRLCAANAKLFSKHDLFDIWTRINFYWCNNLCGYAVYELFNALSDTPSNVVCSLCEYMLKYRYNDNAFDHVKHIMIQDMANLNSAACECVGKLLEHTRKLAFIKQEVASIALKYLQVQHQCQLMDTLMCHIKVDDADAATEIPVYREALCRVANMIRQHSTGLPEQAASTAMSTAAKLYILFGNEQICMSHHDEFALPTAAIDFVKKYDSQYQQGLNYGMWVHKAQGSNIA